MIYYMHADRQHAEGREKMGKQQGTAGSVPELTCAEGPGDELPEFTRGVNCRETGLLASRKDTLCWTCQLAGMSRCEWDATKGMEPVKGWTAEKTLVRMTAGRYSRWLRSFKVIECPLYAASENAWRHSGGNQQ